MKKHLVRLAIAFLGFSALAIAAKAQVPDQLVINIPYEFVVAGKTLPPGTLFFAQCSSTIAGHYISVWHEALLELDFRVGFHVILALAAAVCNCARREIDSIGQPRLAKPRSGIWECAGFMRRPQCFLTV